MERAIYWPFIACAQSSVPHSLLHSNALRIENLVAQEWQTISHIVVVKGRDNMASVDSFRVGHPKFAPE